MYGMDKKDKILGGLMGVAVGDALGCTLEFSLAHMPHKRHTEIIGEGPFNWNKGDVTDDTDMTMCVARGILNNPTDPIISIGEEFIKWYNTNPVDIGNTCRYSIQNGIIDKSWENASLLTHYSLGKQSAGNGSLMRTIPVALYYDDTTKMKNFTCLQSEMTHYDMQATESCLIYNRLIENILKGATQVDIIKFLQGRQLTGRCWLLKRAELKPTGFSVDSLKCALWCFMNTGSFEEAVTEAVNLGGDTDTIGAITGGLAGAFYGYDKIPKRWVNEILSKDEILKVGNQLYEGGN